MQGPFGDALGFLLGSVEAQGAYPGDSFPCPLGAVSVNPCDCLKGAKCRTVTLFCTLCISVSFLSCCSPHQIFFLFFFFGLLQL